MIQEGIRKGVYETSRDTALDDFLQFQSFFRRSFKNYEHFDKMRPAINQLSFVVMLKRLNLT